MTIERQDNNITLITRKNATVEEMVDRMEEAYMTFKNDNVIVNLTSFSKLELGEILKFLLLSNKHRKARHSFVLVNDSIDLEQTPDELVFVPTLQEAYDIIEMEDMERDLGF